MADQQIKIDEDTYAVINQIQQTISGNTVFAPFGVDDQNVQIYNGDTKWGSLRNFFQEWSNFKNVWNHFLTYGKFIQYGKSMPTHNSVKVWFDTSDNQNNDN